MKIKITIILILSIIQLNAQTLTISSSGQTGTSGTNWSISGNVLSVIGTANIRASVITDALTLGSLTIVGNTNSFIVNQSEAISSIQSGRNLTIGSSANTGAITFSANISINGSLIVYGGSIALNSNLTTTLANAPILIKATNAITASGNQIFNTNNGDFILWADSDNSGQGIIHLLSNPVINTANGSTSSGLSGGGKIVIAGGLDNGANGGIANDGIPDGFAINASGIGVYFNCQSCYSQMYSGGGDIIIRGASTFASSGVAGIGLYTDGRWLANAGKGSIILQGSSTHFYAVNLTDPGGNNIATGSKYLELISDKADGNAISITGASNASYGVVFNYENPKEVRATGGGAISITGAGGGGLQGIFIQNTDFLATTGEITMNGGTNGIRVASSGTRIGSRVSSPITSSTSNIKWIANSLDLYTLNAGFTNSLNTSGTVTIEPFGTSFTSAITFPITGLTLSNNITGLTLGKLNNTANITLAGATSISGPIIVHGGTISVNANLTSTATSGTGVSLNGRNIIHAAGISTVTSGSNIAYLVSNSPWTSAADIGIALNSAAGTKAIINAQGGNIEINSSFASTGINNSASHQEFGIITASIDILTSGSGTISINGDIYNNASTSGQFSWGVDLRAGTLIRTNSGNITITGRGGRSLANIRGVVSNNTSLSILSNSGTITISDIIPTGNEANYTGMYFRPSLANSIKFGADGTLVTSSSSNINFIANRVTYELGDVQVATFGKVTIVPEGSSFGNPFSTASLNLSSSVSELTIGKIGNNNDVTIARTTSIAGPVSIYGGNIFAQQNLTSTTSGAAILMQATGYIDVSASDIIQTNNGNITLRANASGTAVVVPNSTTGAITLNSGSSLLSNGGNITLGGNFDGTKGSGLYAASARVGGAPGILISGATINAAGGNINIYGRCSTSYDDGIRLQGNISTTGSGSIGIYGDAFGGLTAGTPDVWFGGITFITNPSTIETENGNINIEGVLTNTQSNGTYALNFYRTAASGTNARDIQIVSKTGNIQITGDRGTTSAGGMGHSSWGHIYVGSPLSGSWTASGQVKFSYSSFVGAGIKGFKVKTIGAVVYEPTASSFVNAQTFPYNSNYIVAENASSLTIGKPSNTSNITSDAVQNISGPIQIYGGDILINENLNTVAGASAGSVLLKGSGDVILAANKSITTSGAPVILWANSDNGSTNGSIALRNGSSIITGSNSVPGGHIWLGGGSDGTTWNGLSVGSGYAVPGISYTPSNGGSALSSAGIYLERNSISSFGGNIKILGDAAASGYAAIATYGNTITINAGSGKIEMDGQVTNAAAGNRMGILFGFHDNIVISTVNISSSSTSGDAIRITGVGRGTEDAIGLSGTLNIIASGGGNIVINGNAMGTGRSIVAGNYYHGIMNIFANSGNISLNGNTKAVQVSTALFSGLTTGPSKINIGQGGIITSSSSDVFLTADNIALAAGGINVNTSGKVTIESFSNSFTNAISYPISTLSMSNTISGLTIGKLTNNSNVSFTSNQTIAGPISAYGGQINIGVGVNLTTTTANGHITLWGKNGFITDANSGSTRGRIMTAGGNIDINADSDDNNTGLLDIDWLTIDGNTGNVSLEGANFIWSTASGVTFPEFYGTGALSIRSSSQSSMPMNTTWIALFNTKSALTLGNPSANNSGGIDIVSCVNCNSTATNFSGKTLQVNGPITLYGPAISISQNLIANNSGTISFYGNTFTINASNTISSLGNLILTPKSNSTTIGLGGASGTLSLPASYFSTNFSDGFANIQIGSDSQTGNIAANTFTLRDNMTFLTSGSLTLGGKPILGNNNITLGSSISSISANASNYFQTNGTGKVISTLANNAARLYPVGNAFYNGVTITNKTNISDTFSVLIKDSVLGNGDTGRQITTPHVKTTWDISKNNTNGGNGVDFEFNWSASQEVGGINTFVLNHHNDTVWQIASGTAGSVSGTTTKSMSHTGYMGRFSPFAFGPGVTPLPVELIKFQATCQSDYIQIDWTTASEKRNKAFELFKSDDAQNWKLIHTTEGQGTKATETKYSFNDLDKKESYYRLKDIDEDGIENWSQIIFADCKNEVSNIQIFPNPATDFIKVIVPQFENTTINIINLEGKIIKTMPLISNQSIISVKDLINGIYMIELSSSNEKIKFVKE